MTARQTPQTPQTPQRQAAQRRARYLTDVLWHVGAFVIINVFFWTLDLFIGAEGIQWAWWITLFWGFALAFHVLAYWIDGRQVERRASDRFLDEEQRRP